MNVLMVEPGKAPYKTQIGDDLQSMQAVVGGYIQAVYPYEEPVALICNEDGKLDGLPLNRALRDADGDIYDIVAGRFFTAVSRPRKKNKPAATKRNASITPTRSCPTRNGQWLGFLQTKALPARLQKSAQNSCG